MLRFPFRFIVIAYPPCVPNRDSITEGPETISFMAEIYIQ